MNYYIQENNKIILFDTDINKLQNTLLFMPQYADLPILETENEIITLNNEFVFKDDKLEELAQIKLQELVNQIYEIKAKKAYGGVIINDLLIFETNQISITNTVASLSLMNDTSVATWKFYTTTGEPFGQELTKIQLYTIAQFGQNMINECFAIESQYNNILKTATIEQLNDLNWCELFITEVQESMNLINNKLDIDFEQEPIELE